jgi:hypothetical protein
MELPFLDVAIIQWRIITELKHGLCFQLALIHCK